MEEKKPAWEQYVDHQAKELTKEILDDPIWSETKEVAFKKALEDFKASNRRIPSAAEEAAIWEMIYYTKEIKRE